MSLRTFYFAQLKRNLKCNLKEFHIQQYFALAFCFHEKLVLKIKIYTVLYHFCAGGGSNRF